MSTIALKELLDELGAFDVKEVRRKNINTQAHSIIIEKEDLIEQFAQSLAEQYRLRPDEIQEVKNIVNKEWGGIYLRALQYLKKPRRNIVPIFEGKRIVAIYYGPRSNYYAITDDFFKPTGAYYPIWSSVLRKLRDYIVGTNRRIQSRTLNKGSGKGETIEAFGIADLFDQGHYLGSNIHYAVASVFEPKLANPDIFKVLATAPVEANPYNEEENILVAVSSKFSNERPEGDDFKKTITVRLEHKGSNRRAGANQEKAIRPTIINHVRRVLSGITPTEWATKESSDSVMRTIDKSITNVAIKAGAKGKRRGYATKPNEVSAIKKDKTQIRASRARMRLVGPKLPTGAAVPSWLSLIEIINAQLPPKVRANMGSPRLNNLTGRLSESARVTNIVTTSAGFPSIEYTYQRTPYDVFDKTLGKSPWNTPERDPSELVGMSVRQIAQEMGFRRFYTRRAR